YLLTLLMAALILDGVRKVMPVWVSGLAHLSAFAGFAAHFHSRKVYWMPVLALYKNSNSLDEEKKLTSTLSSTSTSTSARVLSYYERLVYHLTNTLTHLALLSIFMLPFDPRHLRRFSLFNLTLTTNAVFWALWNHWLLQASYKPSPSFSERVMMTVEQEHAQLLQRVVRRQAHYLALVSCACECLLALVSIL